MADMISGHGASSGCRWRWPTDIADSCECIE